MNYIKIIFLFIVLLIPSITFAGKGYDIGGGLVWTYAYQKTLIKTCAGGKSLLGIYKNKTGLPRKGTAQCYVPDNTPPTINVNFNGYTNNKWTNTDVKVSFSVSDGGSGVNNSYYIVNGEVTIFGNSDTIDFTDDGVYNLDIISFDKSTSSSVNGGTVEGNKALKSYIIKIDRFSPVFSENFSGTSSGWLSYFPVIVAKIKDLYKGAALVEKTFICPANPTNSSWSNPVSLTGSIQGYCPPGSLNCLLDINFTPNLTQCNWECNSGYIKGSDNQCYIASKNLTCPASMMPTHVYTLERDRTFKLDGLAGVNIYWSNPNPIDTGGNFSSFFSGATLDYSPKLSACSIDCSGGYHKEASRCVNDTAVVCCGEPLLSISTGGGPTVDCSLLSNSGSVECVESSLCGFKKELLAGWNNTTSTWEYETTNDGKQTYSQHCGYSLFNHSNGHKCFPQYYLTLSGVGKPIDCVPVPVGEYSGYSNNKYNCTNKPANSIYTSGSSRDDCNWKCDTGYKKVGSKCKKK